MSQPFLGEIRLFGYSFAPRGWHFCDGSILSIQQYTALFSLLGTTYGGNGSTNFGLPDLRGRANIHFNTSNPQGVTLGTETVTLLPSQLPMHNHSMQGVNSNGSVPPPNGHYYANSPGAKDPRYAVDTGALTMLMPNTVQQAGGSTPHENMQPFLVLNYSISLTGIFPSRN